MILNSKQLEELENIQDASGEFDEESGDSEGYIEGVENALAWRRGMIERAVLNIRKIIRKPLEASDSLAPGNLVYLGDAKKFARVIDTAEGKQELQLVFPSSGLDVPVKKADKEKAKPKKEKAVAKAVSQVGGASDGFVAPEKKGNKETKFQKLKPEKTEPTKEKTAPKVSPKATLPAAKKEPPKTKAKKASEVKEKASAKKPAKATVTRKIDSKKKDLKGASSTDKKKKPKPVVAPKSNKKPTVAKKKSTKPVSKKSISGKKKPKRAAASQGASAAYSHKNADPVADPNGYIRGNFRLMSNKELSHVTGLSEHTIRRKLGEWGLKRL